MKNKALIWVLSIVIVLLVAGLGVTGFFLGKQMTKKTTPTPTVTQTISTTSKTTTTVTPVTSTTVVGTTVAIPTTTSKAESFKVYVNVVEGLRLRKGASTTADVITVMPFGADMVADSEADGWYHVTFGTQVGYCSKDFVSKTNPLEGWITYTNSTYKFTIMMPASWKDYAVVEEAQSGSTTNFRFNIPTTDVAIWHNKWDAYVISVYTKDQWNVIKGSEDPKPSELAENATYVFAFSQAQALPDDLQAEWDNIPKIRATFKLL